MELFGLLALVLILIGVLVGAHFAQVCSIELKKISALMERKP